MIQFAISSPQSSSISLVLVWVVATIVVTSNDGTQNLALAQNLTAKPLMLASCASSLSPIVVHASVVTWYGISWDRTVIAIVGIVSTSWAGNPISVTGRLRILYIVRWCTFRVHCKVMMAFMVCQTEQRVSCAFSRLINYRRHPVIQVYQRTICAEAQ
jgi:hypothetical protein